MTRTTHTRTRENDEYACSCGLRWDIKEDDPHWIQQPRYRELSGGRVKDTLTGYVSVRSSRRR